MSLVSEEPVPVGVPVSIQTVDWLALGEVCRCRHEYSHYAIGLQLDQFVKDFSDLEVARSLRLDEETAQELIRSPRILAAGPVA